ncbi:MAG: hypothetical protein WBE28_04250 [bacterium]
MKNLAVCFTDVAKSKSPKKKQRTSDDQSIRKQDTRKSQYQMPRQRFAPGFLIF